MTVIAAIKCKETGKVYVGSDTLAVCDGTKLTCDSKWIVRDGWGVGVAGTHRTQNIIEANSDSLFAELKSVHELTIRLRELLIQDGYNGDSDPGPKNYEQQLIIANQQGVWMIGCAFSIVRIPDGEMWVDGSGRAYGLGAGHASFNLGKGAMVSLIAAIDAAKHYCNQCGGETRVRELAEGKP